ncbi:hypothetical protein ACQPYK_39775 [Streptosporangium sp. CA-135522]|uniref:hypothetical protein n=1 Tax=Streptosporangium sp. CA-135522 TaxID=3240072 RepID=UPI003D94C943
MGGPGRPQGSLKGETEQANALAEFLRELTGGVTIRQLGERYRTGKTSWSEYRSGAKVIPFHLLERIINDHVRDPDARTALLARGKHLHDAAETAGKGLRTTPEPRVAEGEAQVSGAPGKPVRAAPGERHPGQDSEQDSAVAHIPTGQGIVRGGPARRADNSGGGDGSGDEVHGAASDGGASGIARRGAPDGRWSRRRVFFVVAISVLVAAGGTAITIDHRTSQVTASTTDVNAFADRTDGVAEAGAVTDAPETSAHALSRESVRPDGERHLYRLAKDHGVDRWSGSGTRWTRIGGPVGRIYAGEAGLFATASGNGDIFRYDGIGHRWIRIGDPGAEFAVGDHLYRLAEDRGTVWQWNGADAQWTEIGGPSDGLAAG